jgi:hypothetical protein
MPRLALVVLALVATSSVALAQGRSTRFWNLTQDTISEFYLAPAGTTHFGPNQCKNDKSLKSVRKYPRLQPIVLVRGAPSASRPA